MPDPEPVPPGPPAVAMATETIVNLPNFPEFQLNPEATVNQRWGKYLKRFERLITALGITKDSRKRALLLHYAGPEVDDIFDTLEETGDDENYKQATDALTAYFCPKGNTVMEVYSFRQARQEPDESIDAYQTRLRQLAKTCEFHDDDREICDQIITGTRNDRLRRKALRENLDLKALMKAARADEASQMQAIKLEETHNATVNKVHRSSQEQEGTGNTEPILNISARAIIVLVSNTAPNLVTLLNPIVKSARNVLVCHTASRKSVLPVVSKVLMH